MGYAVSVCRIWLFIHEGLHDGYCSIDDILSVEKDWDFHLFPKEWRILHLSKHYPSFEQIYIVANNKNKVKVKVCLEIWTRKGLFEKMNSGKPNRATESQVNVGKRRCHVACDRTFDYERR